MVLENEAVGSICKTQIHETIIEAVFEQNDQPVKFADAKQVSISLFAARVHEMRKPKGLVRMCSPLYVEILPRLFVFIAVEWDPTLIFHTTVYLIEIITAIIHFVGRGVFTCFL